MSRPKLQTLRPAVQSLSTAIAAPLPQSTGFASPLRGTRHQRGYGYAWDKLRATILKRDGYQCQECKRQGRLTAARDVDHIINKASGGDDSPSNLQSLCRPCHTDKTQKESNGQT